MKKFNLKDFVRAMKYWNRDQINGRLFALDKQSGEVCACALGQGVLNYGVVSEEEIKTRLLKEGQALELEFMRRDGTNERKMALTSDALENEWNRKIQDELGMEFYSLVSSNNDQVKMRIPGIIDKIFTKFGAKLV